MRAISSRNKSARRSLGTLSGGSEAGKKLLFQSNHGWELGRTFSAEHIPTCLELLVAMCGPGLVDEIRSVDIFFYQLGRKQPAQTTSVLIIVGQINWVPQVVGSKMNLFHRNIL